jgi:hypothetical protein
VNQHLHHLLTVEKENSSLAVVDWLSPLTSVKSRDHHKDGEPGSCPVNVLSIISENCASQLCEMIIKEIYCWKMIMLR